MKQKYICRMQEFNDKMFHILISSLRVLGGGGVIRRLLAWLFGVTWVSVFRGCGYVATRPQTKLTRILFVATRPRGHAATTLKLQNSHSP